MFYSVADGLTFLYFLFILVMVIITNLFAFLQKQPEIQIIPATTEMDLEQPLMEAVVINQCAVLIIGEYCVKEDIWVLSDTFSPGGLGSMLTLVAIPYVRLYYGPEFSLLQLNSVVLILHMSLADLLYCAVGFPHFIQVINNPQANFVGTFFLNHKLAGTFEQVGYKLELKFTFKNEISVRS